MLLCLNKVPVIYASNPPSPLGKKKKKKKNTHNILHSSIDNPHLEMAYALCDELQNAQPLKCQPL